MPRTIPAALASHIAQGGTSLVELIKITPTVGAVLAFTSHPTNLTVDGQLYLARPGMKVSLVKSNLQMEIDTSEGSGFFAAGVVTLADVLRGKFNDALFERRFCNSDVPSDGGYTFQSGYIGKITVNDHSFSAEMRSLLAVLSQPVGRITSKRCDVRRVGDSRCKFDMTSTQSGTGVAFRQTLTIATVIDQITFTVTSWALGNTPGSPPLDWFRGGVVTWLTGNNKDYESEIAYSELVSPGPGATNQIGLVNAPGQDIQVGDTFYAYAGCSRMTASCEIQFRNASQPNGNMVNFRGFPHLIGDDLYMAADGVKIRPLPDEGI